ncbi:MAG: hypothetical protein KC897_05565 [Candidatus Omnitrophica bacterium]|nr:hypothetical protein [Candidatus Omnitrophota bacterium]MCB9721571.1 hypothetical protein [Candidatus Omnitrophota bacterium]
MMLLSILRRDLYPRAARCAVPVVVGLLAMAVPAAHGELIKIEIPEQIKSYLDERHYNPAEIDGLSLPPNTNDQRTYFIDGTNGNDEWNGLFPRHTHGDNGPYKTISKATGRYDNHKHGERVLIRGGYYREGFGLGNLTGTADEDHVTTFAPYGDGEVVLDLSDTKGLDEFTVFDGDVWMAKVNENWFAHPKSNVDWAVMDWNHRCCREAIGYNGTDNGKKSGRTAQLVDSSKDFAEYKKEHGKGRTDFIGATVWNITDGSWAKVTSVATTQKKNDTLNLTPLTGGQSNVFNPGDEYAVYQLDSDGKFANVKDTFYIKSVNGEPRTRHIIANSSDWDNSRVPIYLSGKNFYFYGLTIVGAPSIGVMTLGDEQSVVFEKCRFLFTGKHGTSQFGKNIKSVKWLKNFFYATVMMNWPRGNTWGGNGGWPNSVASARVENSEMSGNIVMNGGGEGMNNVALFRDNIIVDNYSMNVYLGDIPNIEGGFEISHNDVIFTGYREEDALDRFYLDGYYNGYQRNYVKMHPNGITIGLEKSGGTAPPGGFHIHHNNVIGCWNGINGYFEVPTAGYQNSIIEDNTVVLMTAQDRKWLLYFDSAGMQLRARKGADFNTVIRRNRVIGADNTDGRHHLVYIRGTDFDVLDVDHNIYSFPGHDSFRTDKGIKNFGQWQKLTGYDRNSVFTEDAGLVGQDWSDSSKIFRKHLQVREGADQEQGIGAGSK